MSMRIFSNFDIFGVPIMAVVMMLLLTSCTLVGPNGEHLSVMKDDEGFYVVSADLRPPNPSETKVFKAMVKGSIYETGEYMSVFGTCLDADDSPVNGSYGEFSAWYPNGTQFIFADNMTELQTSYFVWQGNMSAVQGTYLTQMQCWDLSGRTAFAWGEWQNPYWVYRIALLNESISNLSVSFGNLTFNTTYLEEQIANLTNLTQNISIQIGDLQVNMTDSFEITWDMINSTNNTITEVFYNLSDQIYNVNVFVNDSFYSNETYLAQLLLNITGFLSANVSGTPVNWTEDADTVIYWSDWRIDVQAYDGTLSNNLAYPDVLCYINTTITPAQTLMEPFGTKFRYTEFISARGNFEWTVSCVWA